MDALTAGIAYEGSARVAREYAVAKTSKGKPLHTSLEIDAAMRRFERSLAQAAFLVSYWHETRALAA